MKNFDYLQDLGLTELHNFCSAAEDFQVSNPDISAISARKALEYIVRALYLMKNIDIHERTSLFELVDGEPFREFIGDDKVMMAVHYVRKVGNNGAHGVKVTKKESFFCLINIYNVVAAILIKLTFVKEVKPFDNALIPNSPQSPSLTPATVTVTPQSAIVQTADKDAAADKTPVAQIPTGISEAETRRLYIDLMLKEAGWEVLDKEGTIKPSKACIEVEVDGMPNKGAKVAMVNEYADQMQVADEGTIPSGGKGYCDYVLFGGNGLPLAVIEAKKASISPVKGKHQAELYAECLEKRYGIKPVIYYTNGFETYIIDGLGYPPRRLYAFHSENDLELLIQKRKRHNITDFSVNDNITDRHYQKMAIKSVCEHFNNKHRRGLLVMATGTGKTRVAISLVDVLARNGWVKNVLFLADRIPLVSQAHKNFVKLLPNMTTSILSEDKDPDTNARITFSTYQTMINYIDTDEKAFSVGRFDLIVIDEAHRSIFGKYSAIFNYFDGLLVGLTATPRDEVDRSTYETFQMEQGVPNFAYELEDAVADHYLVNYIGLKRGSLILKDGIKYDSLSDEEKKQLESVWEYEKARKAISDEDYHRNIQNNEIFSYIFNKDTIDHVLQDLMENGLKVQSGERIGKTIIFAYNHRHAEMIVERFYALYPEYAGESSEFCALIDNYVTYSKDLIDRFEIRDGNPQIAVSVDMLDTGIDVPDVLNLVFFKIVKSKIKFMQMIGRGTRLSENIFGNGKDKEFFYIFDWCRNFEYFGNNPDGQKVAVAQSLTEKIFALRARIAFCLQHQKYQEDQYAKGLHDEIKTLLCGQVSALSDSHISVRERWETVSHFKGKEAWNYLSEVDVATLGNEIAPLLPKNTLDENAKKFDLLVLIIELSFIDGETNAGRAVNSVRTIAEKLQEKATLPQVQAKMGTIKEVLSDVAWQNVSLSWLEKVRNDLRDLVKFLLGQGGKWFMVDIEDSISDEGTVEGITPRVSYRQSVLDFLANNRNLPVLKKIYEMEQLTTADIAELERILWNELGSKNDYDSYTKGMTCGSNVAVFIRSMVGVDRKNAIRCFSKFISGSELNAEQEDFLMTVIAYVCENGDITKETLVNEPPFDERLSVFDSYMLPLAKYIDNIHSVITPITA